MMSSEPRSSWPSTSTLKNQLSSPEHRINVQCSPLVAPVMFYPSYPSLTLHNYYPNPPSSPQILCIYPVPHSNFHLYYPLHHSLVFWHLEVLLQTLLILHHHLYNIQVPFYHHLDFCNHFLPLFWIISILLTYKLNPHKIHQHLITQYFFSTSWTCFATST